MCTWMSALLLGACLSAQTSPPAGPLETPDTPKSPTEKNRPKPSDRVERQRWEQAFRNFLENRDGIKAPPLRTAVRGLAVKPALRPTCSVPLKNVLPPRWGAPEIGPDHRMIRPLPPESDAKRTIRQVPLPAPSCDDVK